MKKTPNISIVLLMTFFIGVSFWQNERNQKQNQEIISKLVSNLEKENKDVETKDFLFDEKEEKINLGMSQNVPEVQASSSKRLNPNDKMFNTLINLSEQVMVKNITGNGVVSGQGSTSTDINGDGLIDFLFHECRNHTTGNYSYDLMIFTNNGNGFDQTYYCYHNKAVKSGSLSYQGDCAG